MVSFSCCLKFLNYHIHNHIHEHWTENVELGILILFNFFSLYLLRVRLLLRVHLVKVFASIISWLFVVFIEQKVLTPSTLEVCIIFVIYNIVNVRFLSMGVSLGLYMCDVGLYLVFWDCVWKGNCVVALYFFYRCMWLFIFASIFWSLYVSVS